MRLTLKDRIAYHRSFTMHERYTRLREKLCRAIARRLPGEVRKWVIIQRHADLTSGDFSSKHPGDVSAFDLYRGLD